MGKKTEPGPSIYPNCGTRSAYYRHLRNDTTTCQKCRDAAAKSMSDYRHETGISTARIVPDTVLAQYGIKVTA
jgi:hypothetical protein